MTIEDVLDRGPEKFTKETYQRKCELVLQHIFDSYFGEGLGAYVGVAESG